MDTTQLRPNVYEFLDATAYLKAYYDRRKKRERGFSYEVWSAELSFRSRSFLRMIVTGKKKITPSLAEAFANNVFPNQTEKDYFLYLVRYSQASNPKDRALLGKKLISLIKDQSVVRTIEPIEDFVSNPLLSRVLSLFSYPDFEKTSANLARLFSLKQTEVESLLTQLEKMNLISRSADGRSWQSDVDVFRVPDTHGSLNLTKFHDISLRDAARALHHASTERRFKSLILHLDDEGFKNFNSLLDEFSAEQLTRFNSDTCRGKKTFQANFNIYPVTEEI